MKTTKVNYSAYNHKNQHNLIYKHICTDLEGDCCHKGKTESYGQVEPQTLGKEASHCWLYK